MDQRFKMLEFDKILEMLSDIAMSRNVKEKITRLCPYLSEAEVNAHTTDTTDARKIIESFGSPPLSAMEGVANATEMAVKGAMLSIEEISGIGQFLNNCGRMKRYLKKGESVYNQVAYIGNTLNPQEPIWEAIDNAIRGGMVDDRASAALRTIRRKKIICGERVRDKLSTILRNNKSWFADSFVSTRNGRTTLPVKREYKSKVPGVVVDTSQSGNTLFIEPSSVRALQDELYSLQIEEENEIRTILYGLSALIAENAQAVGLNIEAMETLDFLFAKAKLSLHMKAIPAEMTEKREIKIIAGRHPLLQTEHVVPLDFEIGKGIKAVLITGPNTGGKTVALKTAGLLSLMAQSGLHIPAGEGSRFCLFNMVYSDIGDGQSITENLSTFSSHMSNIIRILEQCSRESLVLLDELGSGTDPAEGMGIAVAVLEALKERGCLLVATTHYPEIKAYAQNTPGFVNARMAFDRQSLEPLYRLEIGFAGESCALYIAKRLGLPDWILKNAYEAAYGQEKRETPAPYWPDEFHTGTEEHTKADFTAPALKQPARQNPPVVSHKDQFNRGDSVIIYPKREIGIVFAKADAKGMIGVQIKKKKSLVNHKRLKLHVPASEMYPEDYDFSIVFDSVENRKARHKMEKGHQAGLTIIEDIIQ